jgi:outer membrane lipoprotein carrier protein
MSRFIKAIMIGVLFLTMQAVVFADSANVSLNDMLKNIHSMRADFTQQIVDNKGQTIHKVRGKMALKRPGKFRWETTYPNKQLVVASATRLWIYDADLEQVTIRALAKQTGETPALLLSDANPVLEADFKVTSQKSSDADSHWYMLTPKDPSSMFESIRLGFKGNQLQEMQLKDHLGHDTIIQFKNIQSNIPLADASFNFTPPKHVDIIDETKK